MVEQSFKVFKVFHRGKKTGTSRLRVCVREFVGNTTEYLLFMIKRDSL